MLLNLKTTAIATVTAASLALTSASPAAAWGQREQDFLKGAVSALVLKAIIDDAKQDRKAAPVYRQQEQPRPRYYQDERPQQGRVIKPQATSIYQTHLARAFNSYSRAERRLIQKRLAHWGYYRGGLDGAFGPGTYSAITAYASDQGRARDLGSTAGAFGVLDGLIF